ncbi:nucleoside/nucleotide kinase family protein [Tessaracoccus terricola]
MQEVVDATVANLVRRAENLAVTGERRILGIVGPPGAGKTTLGAALSEALAERVALVPMDGFHLDNPVLEALGSRDRKGAPDTFDVAGFVALLRRLRARDGLVYAPRFDRSLELAIGSALPVPAETPLVVTEGIYLLHDAQGWEAVRPLLDEVWFIDVAPEELHRRLLARRLADGDSVEHATAWVEGVDAVNGALVERGRGRADLVVRIVGGA